jgi:hypothetical protein
MRFCVSDFFAIVSSSVTENVGNLRSMVLDTFTFADPAVQDIEPVPKQKINRLNVLNRLAGPCPKMPSRPWYFQIG